jgi:hypothetical protein
MIQWSCTLVYIDKNDGDQLTKPFHYYKGCGEVGPLSPSPSLRGAWTMDMGMVHYPWPLIFLQHWTVVSILYFHMCSSLLGELESMQMIVSLVRNILLILISLWTVKLLHGNMYSKSTLEVAFDIGKIRPFSSKWSPDSRCSCWLWRCERGIQRSVLWGQNLFFCLVLKFIHFLSICQYVSAHIFVMILIYGPPAECNTRGLEQCNMPLHSAYTRDESAEQC